MSTRFKIRGDTSENNGSMSLTHALIIMAIIAIPAIAFGTYLGMKSRRQKKETPNVVTAGPNNGGAADVEHGVPVASKRLPGRDSAETPVYFPALPWEDFRRDHLATCSVGEVVLEKGKRMEKDWVDGYFSDDSSFYGDDELKAHLEDNVAYFDHTVFWKLHPFQPATIAFTTMAQEASASVPGKALYNVYEGSSNGRQLSETVAAFLSRLPPLTTQCMTSGPWIFIGNPYTNFRHTNEDLQGFKIRGLEILEEFDAAKAGIEASMAGKASGIITRKLTSLRKQLENHLYAAAKEKGCTTGKWMLFPGPDYVNSTWSLVATATANNELGIAAKVATDDGNPNKSRLICVYTENFEDKGDVNRVLERLHAMGLCSRNAAIYYKADAYSHLDIMGGNEWGLKPSLYSSKEMLAEGE